MSTFPSQAPPDVEFPILAQPDQKGAAPKLVTVSASSLLATSEAAKSQTNIYKTLSPPIDRIAGPFLRPGYGLQISAPPGTHVEQLLIGLVKNVSSAGKEVVLVGTWQISLLDVCIEKLSALCRHAK